MFIEFVNQFFITRSAEFWQVGSFKVFTALLNQIFSKKTLCILNDFKFVCFSFVVEIFQNYTPVSRHLISEELLKPNSAIITCISNERVTSEDHFQVN